jgi:hypothetical protein
MPNPKFLKNKPMCLWGHFGLTMCCGGGGGELNETTAKKCGTL